MRRLHRYMLYMTAVLLCPVLGKRAQAESRSMEDPCRLQIEGSEEMAQAQGERPVKTALTIFGRVLGTLPFTVQRMTVGGSEIFIYEFNDQQYELCASKQQELTSLRPGRKVEKSRKTGFDLLRLTLNLARGNLEQGLGAS